MVHYNPKAQDSYARRVWISEARDLYQNDTLWARVMRWLHS